MSEVSEVPFCYPQPCLENNLVALEIFDPTIHTSPFVSAIKSHPSILKYIVFPTVETDADFNTKIYSPAATSAGECFYAVIDKTAPSDSSYAGVLCLLSTNTTNASTEIGAFIFPEFQRTHVTSNAIGLLLQYVLDPPSKGGLGLRRVEWRCHPGNTASRKTAEGLGFVLEGILRWQRVFPGGEEGLTLGVGELERRNGTSGEVPGRHTAVYSIVWDEWDEKREMVVKRMERRKRQRAGSDQHSHTSSWPHHLFDISPARPLYTTLEPRDKKHGITSATVPQEYPANSYAYSRLPENDSIRLLLLQPALSPTTEVHCSLIHTTLTECAYDIVDHYVALSYVWGSIAKPKTIWVDDLRVNVTANLYSALHDIRDKQRVIKLWIDALCINQEDEDEKSVQISIMPDIYRLARVTVIYLGPFDHGAEQLLSTLGPISASHQDQNSIRIATLLVSKEWFHRIWVFQEFVFSREPWIQYGNFRWTWDFIYGFLRSQKPYVLRELPLLSPSYEGENDSGVSALRPKTYVTGYRSISEMERARVMYRNGERNDALSIVSLLPARRGLGCTDPKDMLYAHLSFAAGEPHGSLVVDYSKSCAQIYEDFAYREMEYSSGVDILSHVGDQDYLGRPEGLASWAPDWSTPKLTRPLYIEGPVAEALLDYKENRLFEWHHIWVHEPLTLVLLGHVVDSVTRISVPLSGIGIPPHKHSEFSARHKNIRRDIDIRNEACEEARANLCGDIYEAWRELVKDDRIMPPWNHCQTEQIGRFFEYVVSPVNIDFFTRLWWHENYTESRQVIDYFIWYFSGSFDQLLVDGRVLARLASGRLALAPRSAREGDLVLRLPGAEYTPVSARYYGPSLLIRQAITDINESNSKLRAKIKSALATMDGYFKDRWEWYTRQRLRSQKKSGQWAVHTFGLDFEGEDDVFLSCMLVGECVMDAPWSFPQEDSSTVAHPVVDGEEIKVVAMI